MPQGNDQEKTEQATPKRREEAKKKGQIAQSREIPSVLVLFSAMGAFLFFSTFMLDKLSALMRGVFQKSGTFHLEGATAHALFSEVATQLLIILMPLLLLVAVAGIASNLLQVGFLFTAEPLTPKLSKLDPIKGIKRFFSLRSLAEVVKSVLKISVVGGVAFLMVKGELISIPALMQMGVAEILIFLGRVSFNICFYTCLVLIVMAALDYSFQRWQHEKSLKMTKQEVKDELKQREGDPAVKARIKSIQAEMSRQRMMEQVKTADVVITNPTSLAVALKYDAEKMLAPQVIGKGAAFIAEGIKKIAREQGIPVVEHKPLAQTLYKAVEIGDYIPADLYRAVAEILAYVYRLKGIGNKA